MQVKHVGRNVEKMVLCHSVTEGQILGTATPTLITLKREKDLHQARFKGIRAKMIDFDLVEWENLNLWFNKNEPSLMNMRALCEICNLRMNRVNTTVRQTC